ncbi:hypothetical protein [Rhizobium sp. MHM7A]|uniref:hypothetical protein n=1 Tax=Rhizobium sp. MHM7A TaxID=2583233 RepID=UPI001105F5A3|nr:hypothetical protein [Rhizobium sp. MHM7A]TLX16076.1 hypothetical protein FFR93_01780 [Rhizobium sp. MHM7A]
MTKIIYGLSYCEDDGSSESYNWFYMPIELFEDEAVREQRKAILTRKNPRLEFEEWTSPIITDPEQGVQESDQSEQNDDGVDEIEHNFTLSPEDPAISFQLALLEDEAPTSQITEPKIVICHYKMADDNSPRHTTSPITVRCFWSHARDGNLLGESCRYDSLEDFGLALDEIMARLGAKTVILSSDLDISVVEAIADCNQSNAWLFVRDGLIVAEDLGEIPDHDHICSMLLEHC